MTNEELSQTLIELVEKSEHRIDKTNKMIERLTRTCTCNMEMYDKHLTSLEHSRDVAQESAAQSVKLSETLSKMIGLLREDYKLQLDALKNELHTMKDGYQQQMRELQEAYTRLAEIKTIGGSKADVKINL